ncbi:succinoglycan biosynthesis protein [Rhizobium grahamii]|uniref:Succinoglycan biosynthesis protein n=1 Tax=Rhizobium grahamii TaxID=1120045 RepID=A0A5Q0BZP4_9HYPH|nr:MULTISPECIES: succinoglycan biosynthesis protein [Rhizobium]QFY59098.1 succinoglycan biosynthesis protein [Rhizobium grahamii]QRM48381.1 succinoglycan biosynthesis protein [Rhizobium sp. BG6]
MRDTYSRRPNISARTPAQAGRPFGEAAAGPTHGTTAPPEAELLRLIERTLQAQRAEQQAEIASLPLLNRIETILGKRIEAANDEQALPEVVVSEPLALRPPVMPLAANDVRPVAVRKEPPRRSIWPFAVVGALCFLGAAAGTMVPADPEEYVARGILTVKGGPENVAAAQSALTSPKTIAAVVGALKLDHDPEFAGTQPDALHIAVDLLSANGTASDQVSRAEATLASAMQVFTDKAIGTVDFTVTTGSAGKSARVANYLGSIISIPATAGMAGDQALKKANDAAQAELAAFTTKSGEGNVKVAGDLQQQIVQLDADLKAAEQRIVTAKERSDRLRTAKLGDVLTGAISADIGSPALEDRRTRYATAKSTLAQLSANLGPRHPRLVAQQGEVDGLRDAISEELGRLARDSADDAKAAVVARKRMSDQRNALIAQSKDTGVDLAKLTELRDKAGAARARFEDGILTAGVPTTSQIVMQGVPQVFPTNEGRISVVATLLGASAGLAFGLALMWRRRPVDAEHDAATLAEIPVVAEPLIDPVAPAPEPVVTARRNEVDVVRSEIATMRSKLQSYAAGS